MAYEVNNKEINSQCAELLVRPTYYAMVDEVETKDASILFHSTGISIY